MVADHGTQTLSKAKRLMITTDGGGNKSRARSHRDARSPGERADLEQHLAPIFSARYIDGPRENIQMFFHLKIAVMAGMNAR
jgi:hypothetical protein